MTTIKRPREAPRYRIWLKPSIHRARRRLPGHVRQRIKRLIDHLGHEPRPAHSKPLRMLPDGIELAGWEVRRARVDDWRVVYAVQDSWNQIGVLVIARRPPYRYEDLEELVEELRVR